ncbi:MAG TPA: hypothetical protein VML94_08680 [Thermoplasmata archaeon]|nr:hypothetical protein [Thermoplasmata archaeon]
MVFSGAIALASAVPSFGPVAPAASAPGAPSHATAAGNAPEREAGAEAARASGPALPVAHDDLSASPLSAQIPPDAKAPPAVVVTPAAGNVSTSVVFSATGYSASSAFTLTYANDLGMTVDACAGATTSAGAFSCTFVVPPMPAGPHKFTGSDAKGKTGIANFTVKPQLILTPARGLVGTPVTVQGTGFGAVYQTGARTVDDFTVSVSWSLGTVCPTVGQLKMSNAGGFNCTLTIPAISAGPHSFVGLDNASNRASAPFTVIPGLSVGPSFGVDGTNVTFTGTGFGATSDITVKWPEGRACSTVSAGTGGFSCETSIPLATPGGMYTFTANDSAAHVASAPFIVTFLTVSPSSGAVGTNVTLTVGGFEPNDGSLNISWGGSVACLGLATNAFGALTCTYQIPATTAGPHPFSATGAHGLSAVTSFTVEPALRPSPGYGESGTLVTFTGSGYAASSHLVVSWQNGSACSSTTSSMGGFTCSAYVNASGGAYSFKGKDALGDVGTTTFVVTYLTLTPSSGPFGTTVQVSGAGFKPMSAFTVSWGALTVCGGGKISSLGAFTEANCSGAFKVPYTPAGPHSLEATDAAGYSANAVFVVTPKLTFSPSSVQVGTKVTFTGTGYNASSVVSLTWSGSVGAACSNTTSALGAFNCTKYTIPATPTGSYLFTGKDTQGVTASVSVAIGAALTVSPTSGPVNGTALELAASGFAGSSAISISWNRGSVCNGTTSSSGSFSCPFVVPPAPDGLYTFTAVDASSDTASATFILDSLLTENPSSGPVGTLITFQGTGFNANALVTLTWIPVVGGPSVTACTAESSPTGSFTCSFSVPNVPSGAYTFSATQGSGATTVVFTVRSSVAASPTDGPVGTTVTFTGAGYRGLYRIDVNWTSGVACSQTTSTVGTFSCGFTLPATPYGVHTFFANDTPWTVGGDSAQATFTVTPQLTVAPVSGPVGTLLEFNGTGFNRSSGVAVTWAAGPVCTATTSTAGSFQCTVSLPAATFGSHLFTATDGMGHTASASFSVTPQLIASPSSGLVGTAVTFAGTGYASTVSVTVSWSDGTACSNTTSASGGFSCKYTIPIGTPGGVYPFTGADGVGDDAIATFTVSTSLTVSPTKGVAGTPVTFAGTGYAASSALTVTWAAGTACSTTTSVSGTFSCPYTIPPSTTGGSYTFTALDGADDTATTAFVVTYLDVSPAGATPGTLVQFQAGGFTSDSSFSITWSGGTACSGTTTTLGAFACSYTIPSTTVPAEYTFTGTDGASVTATAAFDAYGTPSVSAPLPARAGTDVGQSVTFSTTASGGSGTYPTYVWTESSANLGCTLVNAATITCDPTQAGSTYTVSVTVTDSHGVVSSSAISAKYTVSPALTLGAPTLNRTGADVGQAVTFTANASGGSGGLGYAWSNLPAGCSGTVASIACAPSGPVVGASITVTVTDSNGNSVTSAPLLLTVFDDPTVETPSANLSSADVAEPVSFVTSGSHGSGGYSYAWSGLPTGCSATGAVVACSPTASGTFGSIKVSVTDSNGFRVTSAAFSFTVYPDPTVKITSPSRSSIDLGQSVTFTAQAGNGSGGYGYAWSGLPDGCSGTSASIACTPGSVALGLSITVTVTDSNGVRVVSAAVPFSVYAAPDAGDPAPSSPGADIGQTVTFQASVTGGAPPLGFVWRGLPSGCGGTTATIVCTVSNASLIGLYTISYTVTDANGLSSDSTGLEFRFSADPTVTVPSPSRAGADVNQTVTFSTTAGIGSGDPTFVWNGLPAGCSSRTATVVCTFTAPMPAGEISVTVTDSDGFSVTSAALPFTVYPLPRAGLPTVSAPSGDVGQTVTFAENVTGGSGGLSYAWSNLPGGCTGTTATVVCSSLAGVQTYTVEVMVTDSNGESNLSATISFTVFADPTITTPTSIPPGADVGGSVAIITYGALGSGGLTYAWSGLPDGCTGTTTSMVVCDPTSTSATSITVTVTDSNGFSVTSAGLVFTVSPELAVTLHGSAGSLLAGKSVTFTATVTGGAGPFRITWSGLPSGCVGGDELTVTCTPASSGSYTVEVSVTDTNAGTATAKTPVTVNAAFLGLPAAEGIGLLAGLVLAALVAIVVVAIVVRRRRGRSTAPLPWSPGPSTPSPSESTPESSPPPWSPTPSEWSPPPPPGSTPAEEPSPWDLPPHDPDEGGSPPDSP